MNAKQKHRKQQHAPQQAVIFGLHALKEAWTNPARDIQDLYLAENMKDFSEELFEAAKAAGLQRPRPQFVTRKVLDKKTGGGVHQGAAALSAPLPEIFVQDMIIKTEFKERSLILCLDQVTDPHNVGAIIRSASAFGADGLIMQRRHSPALSGVLLKTACGGTEHLPVAYETNLSRALEALKQSGHVIAGLDERGDTLPKNNDDAPKKLVLVLGAEGKGLRPSVTEMCDIVYRLPTHGAIQSLNVSNAAAVALYAFCPHID